MRIIMFILFIIGLLGAGYSLKLYFLIRKKKNKSDSSYLIMAAIAVIIMIFALTTHVKTKTYTVPEDDVYGKVAGLALTEYKVKAKKISSGKNEKLVEKKNLLGNVKYVVYLHESNYYMASWLGIGK